MPVRVALTRAPRVALAITPTPWAHVVGDSPASSDLRDDSPHLVGISRWLGRDGIVHSGIKPPTDTFDPLRADLSQRAG